MTIESHHLVAPALFVILCALSSTTVAQTASPAADQTDLVIRVDFQQGVYDISNEHCRRLPRWTPDEGSEPPLSSAEARKAAEAWLGRRFPVIKILDLWSAELIEGMSACTWHYRFRFETTLDGRRVVGGELIAVVLFDGSVVEPRDAANGVLLRPQLIHGEVKPPQLIREVKPVSTPDALRAKLKGDVLLEIVVNADGSVGDVKVIRSLDSKFGLDEQAIKAARQWRFKPSTLDGIAVPVRVTISMTF